MYVDLKMPGRVPVDSDLLKIKEVWKEWCQHLDVVSEQGSWHWIRQTMLIWQLTYGHDDVVVCQ